MSTESPYKHDKRTIEKLHESGNVKDVQKGGRSLVIHAGFGLSSDNLSTIRRSPYVIHQINKRIGGNGVEIHLRYPESGTKIGHSHREVAEDFPSPHYHATEFHECTHCGTDPVACHVYHVPYADVWYIVCPICERSWEP